MAPTAMGSTLLNTGRAVLGRSMPRSVSALSTQPRPTRTFFASSTDHTTLLRNATAHRVGDDPYGPREYILVPHGTDLELAKKVDKLQLARLRADKNIIYRAKVVQRSLGSPQEVCGSLLEMALKDASAQGETPQALATLDGLCDWVSEGIEGKENIEALDRLLAVSDEKTYEAVKAIATGIPRLGHSVVGVGTFKDGQSCWEELGNEFVEKGLSAESALYQSRGGELVSIDHLGDDTAIESAGGAVARFSF